MENEIVGSKVKLQDEKKVISEIVGDKENNDSSMISKGRNGLHNISEQEQNDLKPSPTEKNIKEENLAVNCIETPSEPSAMEMNTDISPIKNNPQEDQKLKYSAKLAEMGQVREENERLKLLLARILKDYKSLQSHYLDVIRDQEANKEELKPNDHIELSPDHQDDHDQIFVSLSLGRASSNDDREKKPSTESNGKDQDKNDGKGDEGFDKLALALGSSSSKSVNLSSDNNSLDNHKEDDDLAEPTEVWPPSKDLKTPRPSGGDDHEDGVSQMSPLKKARVSVRTRCDTPTMNDGCQWRKYGQKISKGNPCPRAYYRCTVSPSCPVRKQVQRCAEDMSILITTYEGTHNHPLPVAATAMASTTAAAASMLQSRSTSSSQLTTISATSNFITPNNPLLINNSINNNIHRQSSTSSSSLALQNHQFYLPNTSISTLNSHPTVTLDLTLPNPNSSSYHNSLLGRSSLPRYPSTSLSFSSAPSSSSSSSLENIPNIMNSSTYSNGYFNYGNLMSQPRNYQIGSQPYNSNNGASGFYQPYNSNMIINNNGNSQISNNDQQSMMMTESIAAATKAIASNPKFQSALAAALTSFVGNGGGAGGSGGSGSGGSGSGNGV